MSQQEKIQNGFKLDPTESVLDPLRTIKRKVRPSIQCLKNFWEVFWLWFTYEVHDQCYSFDLLTRCMINVIPLIYLRGAMINVIPLIYIRACIINVIPLVLYIRDFYTKELNLCIKIKFSNPNIYATWWFKLFFISNLCYLIYMSE